MNHTCLICGGESKKVCSLNTTKKFKANRYQCTVCGYQEMLLGTGYIDKKVVSLNAIKEVDKMFKQQEDNEAL